MPQNFSFEFGGGEQSYRGCCLEKTHQNSVSPRTKRGPCVWQVSAVNVLLSEDGAGSAVAGGEQPSAEEPAAAGRDGAADGAAAAWQPDSSCVLEVDAVSRVDAPLEVQTLLATCGGGSCGCTQVPKKGAWTGIDPQSQMTDAKLAIVMVMDKVTESQICSKYTWRLTLHRLRRQVWVGRRHAIEPGGGLAAWHAWMRLAGDRGARLLPPSRRAWVHEALPAGAALLAGEAAAVGSQQQQQRPAAARQPTAVAAAAVCEQMVLYWRRPDGVCLHSVT